MGGPRRSPVEPMTAGEERLPGCDHESDSDVERPPGWWPGGPVKIAGNESCAPPPFPRPRRPVSQTDFAHGRSGSDVTFQR
ncbi:hypothetical protein EVAR_17595_1 [Eumeta japonica]|uniref:Uncharacterized protein n=1 Tax=Eumeta variegata TaxID=151549 RepID=A0A4C1UDD8_EUMVA|nr:hypothetical protein EVAR_17595_1 [Eumeta japonica]